MRIIKISR